MWLTPRAVSESAIDIHVAETLRVIGRWYSQTDAAKDGMPPHITLLYPWRPHPLRDNDLSTLRGALAGMHRFFVSFNTVGRFPGVLYLVPAPSIRLRELILRLSDAFPDTPPYGGTFGLNPEPHLTVFKATESVLDAVEREVRAAIVADPITVEIREVTVDAEVAPNRWVPTHQVHLSAVS